MRKNPFDGMLEHRHGGDQECEHKPPRSTVGPLGIHDFCGCGAAEYILRWNGNDGSNRYKKRWDRWA